MRLRVSSIDPSATKLILQELFEEHGAVASVKLFRSLDGSTPALAFVEMKRADKGEIALKALNGYKLGNTVLKVELANEVLRHHGTGAPVVQPPEDEDLEEEEEEENDGPREVSLDELPEDY